ncbi:hypothetical protein F5Y14DRAFT_461250 [Nemania sp. NC0429]|nr:hypothetical protein F5Y14DRAFT_461250 [Nemania sp. NC0429]
MAHQGVSSDASRALVAVWLLLGSTFVFVLLRLYVRFKLTKKERWAADDYYYFASFVFFFIYIILIQVSAQSGLGQDISDIRSPDDVSRGILCELAGQTFLIAGNITSKLSVGYFLIILDTDGSLRKWILGPVFIFGVSVTITTIVSWFSCQPIAYLWDRQLDGRCDVDPAPTAFIAGVLSVLVDLWYAGFPWYLLVWPSDFRDWSLPRRQRITIALSLSLGVVAAGFGIKRATELKRLASPNYLRDTLELVVWHSAELAVTLIATGIPAIFPLYKRELNWLLDTLSSLSFRSRRQQENKIDEEIEWFNVNHRIMKTVDIVLPHEYVIRGPGPHLYELHSHLGVALCAEIMIRPIKTPCSLADPALKMKLRAMAENPQHTEFRHTYPNGRIWFFFRVLDIVNV